MSEWHAVKINQLIYQMDSILFNYPKKNIHRGDQNSGNRISINNVAEETTTSSRQKKKEKKKKNSYEVKECFNFLLD